MTNQVGQCTKKIVGEASKTCCYFLARRIELSMDNSYVDEED